jgi:hypothetical protein
MWLYTAISERASQNAGDHQVLNAAATLSPIQRTAGQSLQFIQSKIQNLINMLIILPIFLR